MEKLHVGDNFIVENDDKSTFWDFKGKYEFVDQWFLMGSPYPLVVITGAYLLFVLKLGPDYMKNRKPYQLKNVLLAYNIFQVALSTWMFALAYQELLRMGPVQRTCLTETDKDKERLTTLTYYYFSCKITELADTVLFVLRKKNNQVTFLHVYHHSMMVWNCWAFLKYEPGYWMLFLGAMNCFVHMVMYTYYGLSAYPSLQKYLWWKKYITSLQLLQFGLLLLQMTVNLLVNECKPSKWTALYFYFNGLLFIYLFSSFYKKSYSSENKGKIENGLKNSKNKLNQKSAYENGAKHRGVKKNGDLSSYESEDFLQKNSEAKLKSRI